MHAIDKGVTRTYQDASYDSLSKALDQALVVANNNLVGKSVSEAESVIEADSYGLEPFVKDGCLYAGGLCLEVGSSSEITKVRVE